ncbi:MAG: hypothetical protein AAFR95_11275, partial [Bacteroidota bacterium]
MTDPLEPRMKRSDAPPPRGTAALRNLISKKKAVYPLSDYVLEYLVRYGRLVTRGADYDSLLRY